MWESLEEAIRGEIDDMTAENFDNTVKVFSMNYKGSDDLRDLIESRLYRDADVFAKE